jgi:predicted nucleic acid-binding protein
MPLPLLLDSNILSQIVRPTVEENRPVVTTIARLLRDVRFRVYVPEIIDYELRRKLLHLAQRPHQSRKWAQEALTVLDRLVLTGYLPLTTETMRLAARTWAQTRAHGLSRGPEDSLDVDVILAAQAKQVGGHILTTNERHFRNIAEIFDWRSFQMASPS